MDTSEETPVRCRHCSKEIPDFKAHSEPCPEQRIVNNIRLSHGISVDDYHRLEKKEQRR